MCPLFKPPNAIRQWTQVILCLVPLTWKALNISHIPFGYQMLHNVSIVLSSVNPNPLGNKWEIVKEMLILSIIHQVSRHWNLLPHHVCKGQHGTIRVKLKKFLDNLGVCILMSLLICCNQPADCGQPPITILFGVPGSVSMWNKCCSFLKWSINKPQVGVVLCLGVLQPLGQNPQLKISINSGCLYWNSQVGSIFTACGHALSLQQIAVRQKLKTTQGSFFHLINLTYSWWIAW